MKKIFKSIALASLGLAILFSCTKNEPVAGTADGNGQMKLSVTGVLGEYKAAEGTKASLVNTPRVGWSGNETVHVFQQSDGKYLGSLTSSVKATGASVATLGGTISSGTGKLVFVYTNATMPSLTAGTAYTSLEISLAEQGTDIPFVVYGTAESPGTTSVSGLVVNFSFATSVVSTYAAGLPAGKPVTQATLGSINTKCLLTIPSSGDITVSGSTSGIITKTSGIGSTNAQGQVLFGIAVPVSEAASSGRSVNLTIDGETCTAAFSGAAIAAGNAYSAMSENHPVESVVFVPRYEGGCAVVKSNSEISSFTLDYKVLPLREGKKIADLWNADGADKSILTMNYREVSTRAGLPTLDIESVAFDETDSLLQVTVSLADVSGIFRSKDKSLAVSLEINTGATMVSSPFTDIDNAIEETANCYIVKEAGEYRFNATVRGNGKDTDGNDAAPIDLTGASAKVLWESFGTSDTVTEKDLISAASLESDGYVKFTATDKKGNAVIAVVDEGDNILWSWHIWLTDEPQEQVYSGNAGTMMDRNLGATSATPSDGVKTFGLLYQWGRKDPFLGGSATSGTTVAKSYPDNIHSADAASSHLESNTTLDFSISNPTVFLKNGSTPYDWYCTNAANKNNNLWKSSAASGSPKTMYDPCPPGYRVPDGGDEGVWKKAGFAKTTWESGYNFNISGGTTWYPAAGYRGGSDGTLDRVGSYGRYWSCTPNGTNAYGLYFLSSNVFTASLSDRAYGLSVRCLSE